MVQRFATFLVSQQSAVRMRFCGGTGLQLAFYSGPLEASFRPSARVAEGQANRTYLNESELRMSVDFVKFHG